MNNEILLISFGAIVGLIITFFINSRRPNAKKRVNELFYQEENKESRETNIEDFNQNNLECRLEYLKGRLGRSGCISKSSRRNIILTLSIISFFITSFCVFFLGEILGIFVGLYISALFSVLKLRRMKMEFQRAILFGLPLTLESLILLVESGLGILPAIEKLIVSANEANKKDPVTLILGLLYRLTYNGIPFTEASKMVADLIDNPALRHVLLHLDLSGSEGGSIKSSLRSLSNYSHNEWKVSVEVRVKRLENLVVFPVFTSVIGLMILIAAVPLVSVKEFTEKMDSSSNSLKNIQNNRTFISKN